MHEFICSGCDEDGVPFSWIGTREITRTSEGCMEMRITGRGSSYRVIIGFYSLGCFLCVPEMDMGCPLADWSDLFWNQERIAQSLGQADAVTIATALYDFCNPLPHKQI